MESIAHNDPIVQSALNDDGKFHLDPNLQLPFGCRETYRRDAQAYGDTMEMKGREEGITIGEVNQTIKLVIRLLERTVATPTKEIRSQIESITDLDQANLIFDKVLMREIRTLEDLKSYLSSNDHRG